MSRVALLVLPLIVLAADARADIDRAKYRELPGLGQRMVSSVRVGPNEPLIDAAVRQRYAGRHPSGDYDVYINREGTVDGVHVVRSLEGCDEFIAKRLMTGRQNPKPAEPWVHHVTVELRFESAVAPPAVRAKNVPPHFFDEQMVAHSDPHLPDAVLAKAKARELVWTGKVCANADGTIGQVAVIQGIPGADAKVIETLRTWRLRPQPLPVCTVIRLVYDVPAAKPK